jgi:hypothetical protein
LLLTAKKRGRLEAEFIVTTARHINPLSPACRTSVPLPIISVEDRSKSTPAIPPGLLKDGRPV